MVSLSVAARWVLRLQSVARENCLPSRACAPPPTSSSMIAWYRHRSFHTFFIVSTTKRALKLCIGIACRSEVKVPSGRFRIDVLVSESFRRESLILFPSRGGGVVDFTHP